MQHNVLKLKLKPYQFGYISLIQYLLTKKKERIIYINICIFSHFFLII